MYFYVLLCTFINVLKLFKYFTPFLAVPCFPCLGSLLYPRCPCLAEILRHPFLFFAGKWVCAFSQSQFSISILNSQFSFSIRLGQILKELGSHSGTEKRKRKCVSQHLFNLLPVVKPVLRLCAPLSLKHKVHTSTPRALSRALSTL